MIILLRQVSSLSVPGSYVGESACPGLGRRELVKRLLGNRCVRDALLLLVEVEGDAFADVNVTALVSDDPSVFARVSAMASRITCGGVPSRGMESLLGISAP